MLLISPRFSSVLYLLFLKSPEIIFEILHFILRKQNLCDRRIQIFLLAEDNRQPDSLPTVSLAVWKWCDDNHKQAIKTPMHSSATQSPPGKGMRNSFSVYLGVIQMRERQ